MPQIPDNDKFFSGNTQATQPYSTLEAGTVRRLINARFREGLITNGYHLEKVDFTTNGSPDNALVTHEQLLQAGDPHYAVGLESPNGKYIVTNISGVLYRIDLMTCEAVDITPSRSCLPEVSLGSDVNYLGTDGSCLLYTSPSPRDQRGSRMPSSA